jgi:hypothetical protein
MPESERRIGLRIRPAVGQLGREAAVIGLAVVGPPYSTATLPTIASQSVQDTRSLFAHAVIVAGDATDGPADESPAHPSTDRRIVG